MRIATEHSRHHAQLAREGIRSCGPSTCRGLHGRCGSRALAEIVLGFVYTPLLFLRSVLVWQAFAAGAEADFARLYGVRIVLGYRAGCGICI